jgi:hypothetical protein
MKKAKNIHWTPDQSKPKAKIVARLTAAQTTAAHLLDATLQQILAA